MILKLLTVLVSLLNLQYSNVDGCSCLPTVIHPQKFYCNAPVLFVGKVLSKVEQDFKKFYTVAVKKVLKDPKGLVTYKSEVTLSTCIHSACCGIYLEINSTYLVNSLTPNLCGWPFEKLNLGSDETEALLKRVKLICKCCKKCQVEVCDGKYIYTFFSEKEKCPSKKKKKFCTYQYNDPDAKCYADYGVCCKKKGKCRWKKNMDLSDCID